MVKGSRLLAGFLFALVALTACGGQTSSTASTTTEYKIVAFLDYSGPFANRGKPIAALHQIMIDWWNNNAGKKLGVKLIYEPLDSRYDAGVTSTLYANVRTDKQVIGILTHGSPNVNALWNLVPADSLPVLHGGPCYSFISKPNGYVFTALGDYVDYFRAAAQYFATKTSTSPLKVAFMTFDGTSGHDWANGLNSKMPTGTKLIDTEFIATTAPDVSANVARVMGGKPDLTIVAGTDRLEPMIIEGLEKAGYPADHIVNSQHESLDLLQALGVPNSVLEGTYEVSSWNYTDHSTQAYKVFEAGKSNYPDARWTSGDVLLHFASSVIMLRAIERAATKKGAAALTGADVYDQLKNGTFTSQDLLGFMDTVKFDQKIGGCASPSSISILQMKSGQVQSVAKVSL